MKWLLILLVVLIGCARSPMTPEGTDEFNTDITYCRRDSTYGKYVMVYQKGEGYIDGVLWREQGINLMVPTVGDCLNVIAKLEPDTYWFTYYIYKEDTLQINTVVELVGDTIIQL